MLQHARWCNRAQSIRFIISHTLSFSGVDLRRFILINNRHCERITFCLEVATSCHCRDIRIGPVLSLKRPVMAQAIEQSPTAAPA